MDCNNNTQCDFNSAGKCSRVRYCCPECGWMVTTKYIYLQTNIYSFENRACVCVGDKIFWSNKTVSKKIVERQL